MKKETESEVANFLIDVLSGKDEVILNDKKYYKKKEKKNELKSDISKIEIDINAFLRCQ